MAVQGQKTELSLAVAQGADQAVVIVFFGEVCRFRVEKKIERISKAFKRAAELLDQKAGDVVLDG